MKKLIILTAVLIFAVSCKKEIIETRQDRLNGVSDMEDMVGINAFQGVQIGTQIWMKKNLNVRLYRNGEEIPLVYNSTKWCNKKLGAMCYYDNNYNNTGTYGKLYNWYAVNDPRGLAPKGWHIPSVDEWKTLIDFLGGSDFAGGYLKDTIIWADPNSGATNSVSFAALPGGKRVFPNGRFDQNNFKGYWWTSTGDAFGDAALVRMEFDSKDADIINLNKLSGLSVRCIKD